MRPRPIQRPGPPCPACGAISQDGAAGGGSERVYMCLTREAGCSVETFAANGQILKRKNWPPDTAVVAQDMAGDYRMGTQNKKALRDTMREQELPHRYELLAGLPRALDALDPQAVADAMDREQRESAHRDIQHIRAWLDRLEAALDRAESA